jgi:hypothetical protein
VSSVLERMVQRARAPLSSVQPLWSSYGAPGRAEATTGLLEPEPLSEGDQVEAPQHTTWPHQTGRPGPAPAAVATGPRRPEPTFVEPSPNLASPNLADWQRTASPGPRTSASRPRTPTTAIGSLVRGPGEDLRGQKAAGGEEPAEGEWKGRPGPGASSFAPEDNVGPSPQAPATPLLAIAPARRPPVSPLGAGQDAGHAPPGFGETGDAAGGPGAAEASTPIGAPALPLRWGRQTVAQDNTPAGLAVTSEMVRAASTRQAEANKPGVEVTISIGHIEVRAAAPPASSPRPRDTGPRCLSLDEFLSQRRDRGL